MIRFICREVDTGAAENVGGPVSVRYLTFLDVEMLERWLRYADEPAYTDPGGRSCNTRAVVGVELAAKVTP